MAIITFWSEDKKETGQTSSIAALTTYMSIENNFKVLLLSTKFNDKSLESCFWNLDNNSNKNITGGQTQVSLDSGMDGLSRAILTNRNEPETVRNYSKTVLKDRLEVLYSPTTDNYSEYQKISKSYADAIQIANRFYDLVFVDVEKGVDDSVTKEILGISDIIFVNLTQHQRILDKFIELRKKDNIFNKEKTLMLIGRYDKFSKFNLKNVSRYIGEKKEISMVPYNTLFFEACDEGKVVDYFLRFRNLDPTDRNALFIDGVKETSDRVKYKLQELRMRI